MKTNIVFTDIRSAWQLFREEFASGFAPENPLLLKTRGNNPWFTPEYSLKALEAASIWMDEKTLVESTEKYKIPFPEASSKRLGIIAAGNIPAVGLHDLICGLISGMQVDFKPSSSDNVLIPRFIELLYAQSPAWRDQVRVVEFLSGNYDAFIGTGSNNTNRYFKDRYSTVPSLLRHHRNSLAYIKNDISEEQLSMLADDVFLYFGLGCRNVSLIFVPEDFDLNRMIKAFHARYPNLMDFSRYADAVKYYRSYFALMLEPCWDAGFLLMRQGARLDCPVSCLNVARYVDFAEVTAFVEQNQDFIQCIVGGGHEFPFNVDFGKSQFPEFSDFADGIDTLRFLSHV